MDLYHWAHGFNLTMQVLNYEASLTLKHRARDVYHGLKYYLTRLRFWLYSSEYRVVFTAPLSTPMPAIKRISIGLDFKIVSQKDLENLASVIPRGKLWAFKKRLKKGSLAIIGYSGGEPVSYCCFANEPGQIENFDYKLYPGAILAFDAWVEPSFRGKGIAYYNFKFIFEFFSMRGFTTYMHNVEIWNRKMLRLCHKVHLELYGTLKHRSFLGFRKTILLPPGKEESRIAERYLVGTGYGLRVRDVEFEVIHSGERFTSLKQEWESLMESANNNEFFLTYKWLHKWWNYYGASNKLCIIRGYVSGKLKSIFPFYLNVSDGARTASGRRLHISAKVLEIIGAGLSRRSGFLIDNDTGIHIREMIDFLFGSLSKEWDMADLHLLTEGSDNFNRLIHILKERGYSFQVVFKDVAPYFVSGDNSGDWNSILSEQISAEARTEHLRDKNKINEKFDLKFESELISPDKFIEIFKTIELKGETGTGLFIEPGNREFLSELLESLEPKRDYYYTLMKINGQYSAYQLGFIYNRGFCQFSSAYSAEYSKYFQEYMLMEKMFEDLSDLDLIEIQLLPGKSGNKLFRANIQKSRYSIRIFNNTVKGKILKSVYNYLDPSKRPPPGEIN